MTGTMILVMAMGVLAIGATSVGSERPRAEAPEWARKDVRAGMVGCDTSHAPAFAKAMNSHPEWRVKVVAAYPVGSPDMPGPSVERIPGFVKALGESGVRIVGGMDELLAGVDAVLIESVDGRAHLAQARAAFQARRPTFIDKPFTASLADAREILRLSAETGVPFFSSSCVRFQPEVAQFRGGGPVGRLAKVQASGPLSFEPHHPDLFWYGIHGVEALYTAMGKGCVRLRHEVDATEERTIGAWADGRTGVFRGVKKGPYLPLVRAWGDKGQADSKGDYDYGGLCQAIARFFQTGQAPVDPQETLEIVEFMTAAQISKDRGGVEVTLAEARRLADAAATAPAPTATKTSPVQGR